MKLFDTTLTQLERSLDVRLVRHNVLAGNLANVDTPAFAPKEVDFAAAMATATAGGAPSQVSVAVRTTDGRHIDTGNATSGTASVPIVAAQGDSPTMDGNRVDLDRTMVAMAENGIQYAAGARAAGKKLAILRYVASDGVG